MDDKTAIEIELILHPGTTSEQLQTITDAIVGWCELTTHFSMFQQLRVIVQGGPYLPPAVVAAFWRTLVPPGAVENLLIDGRSVMEIHSDNNPNLGGAEAEMPDAAAVQERS